MKNRYTRAGQRARKRAEARQGAVTRIDATGWRGPDGVLYGVVHVYAGESHVPVVMKADDLRGFGRHLLGVADKVDEENERSRLLATVALVASADGDSVILDPGEVDVEGCAFELRAGDLRRRGTELEGDDAGTWRFDLFGVSGPYEVVAVDADGRADVLAKGERGPATA